MVYLVWKYTDLLPSVFQIDALSEFTDNVQYESERHFWSGKCPYSYMFPPNTLIPDVCVPIRFQALCMSPMVLCSGMDPIHHRIARAHSQLCNYDDTASFGAPKQHKMHCLSVPTAMARPSCSGQSTSTMPVQ